VGAVAAAALERSTLAVSTTAHRMVTNSDSLQRLGGATGD